jgi:hypothetical protein
MDLEVAIAGFQARGGVLLPGQPILGLLDPSGEVAVALPPVPGGPVLSLYLAVAWKPERERIDWVSNCAPLLVAR